MVPARRVAEAAEEMEAEERVLVTVEPDAAGCDARAFCAESICSEEESERRKIIHAFPGALLLSVHTNQRERR